jgi:hypothetical protein
MMRGWRYEMKINDAFEKNDSATVKTLIDPAAWAIDESGLMPVTEFFKMLDDRQVKATGQKLENFKVLWIDANTAVVTYKWSGKGTPAAPPPPDPWP